MMIEMMIKMMTKMMVIKMMTKMIKMMIEPTSLVHLMMIGQNGCKEGREWWRSNLVASIIIKGDKDKRLERGYNQYHGHHNH